MNLMETIHLHKNDFSKTEHKVYDYIVQTLQLLKQRRLLKLLNYVRFQLLEF